jgi:spore coat polysaccharide biosynthesis predicted glycosyltransferase SpsG
MREGDRKILIRLDAGGAVGMGHARRSLALARELQRRGHVVVVCGNRTPLFDEFLAEIDVGVFFNEAGLAEEEFLESLVAVHPGAVLFIDHLQPYRREFIEKIKSTNPVVLFHNDSEGAKAADAVIFPIAHLDPVSEAAFRNVPGLNVFSGFEYVSINEDARQARVDSSPRTPYLALTTGGSDPRGMMLEMIDWIVEGRWPHPVMALYGRDFIKAEKLEKRRMTLPTTVDLKLFNYPDLLGAHLVVSAFGVTPYELIFHGRPVVTVGHNPKAAKGSDRLAEATGSTVSLGLIDDLDSATFLGALDRCWSQDVIDALSDRQKGQMDGRGVERVAGLIEQFATRAGS